MIDDEDAYISPEESGLSAAVAVAVTPIVTAPPIRSAVAVAPVPMPSSPPARASGDPPVPLPDGWTLPTVAALVSEIASNMYDLPYILNKHKLTEPQYRTLEKNPFFQRALEAEAITWQNANSAHKRLALEAAIASEAAMPSLSARLQSKTEPLGDLVALMKLFSEIAGVTGNKAINPNMANSERVRITINLGGEDTFKKDAAVVIDQQALPAA